MDAADRRRSNANGVEATVRDPSLPNQWQESDVSPPVMPTVEIGVRRLGNKPETIDLKELGKVSGILTVEVKRR